MKIGMTHDARGNSRRANIFEISLVALLFALSVTAEAQQRVKIARIGYLAGAGSSPPSAFVQGLRDLGYIQGKNIIFEFRGADGKSERYSELAAELVRLNTDVIVADGTVATLAAKKATSRIPIVMTTATDPVGSGLVVSLAKPGGNVTGLTSITGEFAGKLLELLREILPAVTRAAVLHPGSIADELFVKEVTIPARALKIQILSFPIQRAEEIDDAFRGMTREQSNGLIVRLPANTHSAHFKHVAELSVKNHLPAISPDLRWAENGGLISYGTDRSIRYRRASVYVDKIIKGAKPAELPVEAPTKFELVINLTTAKQLGVTIPESMLFRADRVIK